MIVVRRTKGGSYILAEPSGALSALRYAAFRIIPYFPRTHLNVDMNQLLQLSTEELEDIMELHSKAEQVEHQQSPDTDFPSRDIDSESEFDSRSNTPESPEWSSDED